MAFVTQPILNGGPALAKARETRLPGPLTVDPDSSLSANNQSLP